MPIYEYQCDCPNGKQEKRLPISESDQPQTCVCGKVMTRLMSVSSFVMKQTGKGMALNTLNSKSHQGGMPDRHWKPKAEQYAAAGL